jgi:lysophospholipid acyltransferase (LPLAT)-like uncharacterized protein
VKRLLRAPALQAVLARLFSGYVRFCLATIRWRRDNEAVAEAIWDGGGGVIVCFWHSRIALSPACWPLQRAQTPRALISHSADGRFIAQAMERLGFPAIRGSAEKGAGSSKGGARAFREVLGWIGAGNGVAITPDGPRGPAERFTEGPPMLARLSGAPVLLVGLAADPCRRLGTWDRGVIPLPFARGAIAWDGPFHATRADDMAALAADWSARLSAVTARAEALLA